MRKRWGPLCLFTLFSEICPTLGVRQETWRKSHQRSLRDLERVVMIDGFSRTVNESIFTQKAGSQDSGCSLERLARFGPFHQHVLSARFRESVKLRLHIPSDTRKFDTFLHARQGRREKWQSQSLTADHCNIFSWLIMQTDGKRRWARESERDQTWECPNVKRGKDSLRFINRQNETCGLRPTRWWQTREDHKRILSLCLKMP